MVGGDRCQFKVSACSTQPCSPYGYCVEQKHGYICECFDGADGLHCESSRNRNSDFPVARTQSNPDVIQPNPCPVGTCANEAICIRSFGSTGDNRSNRAALDFICQCDTAVGRFEGPRCDIDVDECVVGIPGDAHGPVCLNGGQCVNTYGSYFCRCPTGWSGPRCETRWRACTSGYHPVCRNGGTCLENENSFQCICPTGFTGLFCETEIDECANKPCRNGGSCLDLIGSYLCLCPSDWTGRNCYMGPRCEGQINLCRLDPQLGRFKPTTDSHQKLVQWIDQAMPAEQLPSTKNHWLHALLSAFRDPALKTGTSSREETSIYTGLCNPQGVSQCVPHAGNFSCLCRMGFHGSLCEQPRDLCHEIELELGEAYCMNEGLCETQLTINPESGTSSETVMCRCPNGYGGSRCQLFTDVCFSNPCLHGGSCQPISHVSGLLSSSSAPLELSHPDRMMNYPNRTTETATTAAAAASTTTSLTRGGPAYECICPPGRVGRHCELDRDAACLPDSSPWCANQAQCIAGPEGSKCNCPPGFCGLHCEKNGTADCAPLIRPESVFASWLGASIESDTCEWNQCATKRGNGRCDPECDRLACDFDALECLLPVTDPLEPLDQLTGSERLTFGSLKNGTESGSQPRPRLLPIQSPKPSLPWSKCTAIRRDGIPCHLRFSDDRCDTACATEACLFDGWDCETESQIPDPMTGDRADMRCPSYCGPNSSEDDCLTKCNISIPKSSSACGNDSNGAGSCSAKSGTTTKSITILNGELVLLIRISPDELLASATGQLNQLLSGLSQLLHLNVSVKRQGDTGDRWMVYGVPLLDLKVQNDRSVPEDQARRRSSRSRRDAPNESAPAGANQNKLIGSQLYLQLDATSCTNRGGSCFQRVDGAAQFVTAAMHHRQYTFLRPVLSVQSTPGTKPTPIGPGERRRWQPFDWLWSVNWPIYAIFSITGMLILMLIVGVMFTATQLSQRSTCQSTVHRRSLSAYLHAIGKKRNAKKIQRAKIWFPEHGLLGRVRPGHKPGPGSTSRVQPGHSRLALIPSSLSKPHTSSCPPHSYEQQEQQQQQQQHQHHQSAQYHHHHHHHQFGDSERLSLMWYLSGDTSEYKPSIYLPTSSDIGSPSMNKRPRRNEVSTFLSSANVSNTSAVTRPVDTSGVGLVSCTIRGGSISTSSGIVPFGQAVKSEALTEAQSAVMSHAPIDSSAEDYRIEPGTTVSSIVSGGGGESGTGSTSTTTTNTVSTRVDVAGSDQDTVNTLHWDRTSLGPVSETWSFYQIIIHLLQSNGLEDLTMQPFCHVRTGGSTETDGNALIRSILRYTINLDRQEQVGPASVDVNPLNPSASHTHICTELHSACPILFPRLCRVLEFRLAETGETLLHAAARLNQASSCTDLLDAGADPTSVDNAGRTALLSAVSSGALDAIHVILAHPVVNSNPMCFVPSFLTDSTTPLMQAIKMGDVDAFRMILHAMNIQICTLAKAHAAINTPIPSTGPNVYPSVTQSGAHATEPLSPTNPTWSLSYGCNSKETTATRALSSDPTVAVINEDNAMSLLDLNMTDNLGRTALHWAAVTDQPDMLSCLLEAGASLDVQTTCDETPLALAAREGAFSACRLLLVAGANPELADYLDRTPKQLAQAAGYEDIVRLFDVPVHPDSAVVLSSAGSRQLGFPQGASMTWSHMAYNPRTRMIMSNQERPGRISNQRNPMFFPNQSVIEEPQKHEANLNLIDKNDPFPCVSNDHCAIWEDSKNFRDESSFFLTVNNPYTSALVIKLA
ncbi:unnamed protein product [Echinostoma caproni]|uniref:EGF-like domain-containing protein n=1 Tax=Echinostoma caproni TaxID=27848 RepID=A0A183A956_9TREM|nr:unnamed protein product [Echinostoma caproni]